VKRGSYKEYLLQILRLILVANYVERFALGLLLQEIKMDLHASDTQLGMLTGIAFAAFYAVAGVPMARWADSGNRIALISVTTALWSAAVGLCGAVSTYAQLLIVRTGVAIGEAGCIPVANSLIAENFDRRERPRAMARYMLGSPASAVVGYLAGGWLNEVAGWRATFVVLGLPGLLLAALARSTLVEPRMAHGKSARGLTASTRDLRPGGPEVTSIRSVDRVISSSERTTLLRALGTLWGNLTFRNLLASYSLISFFGYGITKWQPAFFTRSFGLHSGELGTWLALILGVGGFVGVYAGGELAVRSGANNERLQLRAMALAYSSCGLLSAIVYTARDLHLAMGMLALATIVGTTTLGPLFSTIQTLVPENMRATAVAFIYLVANLIGLGLGPLAAGALSDALRPALGQESLRYALLALCPGYFWGGWHFWLASRTITRDLEQQAKAEPLAEGQT